jgi:hypothetical protein
MVRHDAVRIKCHGHTFAGSRKHTLEGFVVSCGIEKPRAFRGSIDDVVNDARDVCAASAWHDVTLRRNEDAGLRTAARSVLNK